jgi:predicted transposase YdaD
VQFNRFDVATKELVWDDPGAWLSWLGLAFDEPVEVVDSDITTLTATADKVIRVPGPEPYLVNIELQSYHDTALVRTLWFRQVALDYRHELPVLTVVVLLCKEANSPSLSGGYERTLPDGWQTNRYNYKVTRLLEGIELMQQSTTYQKILREGREEGREEGRIVEARQFLRRLGTQQFGEPDAQTVAALEAIRDVEHLETLFDQVLQHEHKSWEDLVKAS